MDAGALTRLIFFGHDAHDAALQRRIAGFERACEDITAFTMRRGLPVQTNWRNVDLGETKDAAMVQRAAALMRARAILRRHTETLRAVDVIYARNLDMLALARWAKEMSGASAKLVYECLDIHRFMTRADALGAGMRAWERSLLRGVDLVVVSSPAFVREYFDKRQPGLARALLVENRMPESFAIGPRPQAIAHAQNPVRIGWFGNLRCRRSLSLLLRVAEALPERVRIVMRGAPARTELGDFEQRLGAYPNVSFGGRYAWPDDLAALYGGVDLAWAGDFHDPGANSKWLLPNRLYEGGYFAAPPIAPADSETGRWIEAHGFGFTLAEPLEEALPAFVAAVSLGAIDAARAKLLAAPESVFVQPPEEVADIIDAALGGLAHG